MGPGNYSFFHRFCTVLCVSMVALSTFFVGTTAFAEQARPTPPPPSRVGPTKAGAPVKLDDIRRRARDRARKRSNEADERDKTGPVAPPPGDIEIGSDKITPAVLEQGLGAEYKRMGKGKRVALNYQDMELMDLVKAISLATGKRFIISGKTRSIKASVYSPNPVSLGEAYQAFLSVLAANGMTVVPSGRFLKIVDSGDAVSANVPICRDGENCGGGDRMVTRLHRVRFVTADDMTQVLNRFKTGDGDITAYAPTNTMIITDYATNVRRMLRIAQELDVAGIGTRIWIEPIYYSSAAEIADLITQLFPPETGGSSTKVSTKSKSKRRGKRRGKRGRGKASPSPARDAKTVGRSRTGDRLQLIIPDERTNQLIIVASERTYLQILELIRALDTPLGEADGEIRVHKLQHADAEELASTLSSLSSGSKTKSKRRGKRGKRAKASSSSKSASLFEGEVQITADKATNSLVIVGSARDYMSLKNVIAELDIERRQVFVEAVIMEVAVQGDRHWGVAFHGGKAVEVADGEAPAIALAGANYGKLSSIFLDPSMLQGLALGVRGPEIEGSDEIIPGEIGISIPAFGVILQALQTSSDVNVLSTPHILAMDNQEAEIQVGQNVPVSTSFASGMGSMQSLLGSMTGGSGGQNLGGMGSSLFPQMSIGRQNVGIKLSLTPHINQFEQVRMEIEVEVSEIAAEGGDLGPIIGQRLAKTTCVMDDQQTVVLGGLVTDKMTQSTEKVPVLGDIPLLGRLFKRSLKRTEKRNLLIFLTPYIIRDNTDFRRIFARKMQERREFIDRYTAFEYHEVQPDIDYDRTNGMLEEINRAIIDVENYEEQQRLFLEQEDPTHVPRQPVGEVPPEAVDAMFGSGGAASAEPDEPEPLQIQPRIIAPFKRRGSAGPPPPPMSRQE